MDPGDSLVIELEGLARLVGVLGDRGYLVIGPTVRSGAIVYDELESADDLPAGYTDVQEPGRYRLEQRDDEARFGYAVGAQSWKRELLPPELQLWRAERGPDGEFAIAPDAPAPPPLAFIGVRSCELHAIQIQDRVLVGGAHADDDYEARRRDAFIVAVNCGEAGGTCFCVSMQTGPKVGAGHDLALTELLDGDGHRFLVEVGSARGAQVPTSCRRDPPSRATTRRLRAPSRTPRRRWAARSTPRGWPSCCSGTASTRAGRRSPTAA